MGLNYRDHAAETGAQIPGEPVVFLKDPSTVVGPYDTVLIPRHSHKTGWEVELGVVVGTRARYLESPARARAHVAGHRSNGRRARGGLCRRLPGKPIVGIDDGNGARCGWGSNTPAGPPQLVILPREQAFLSRTTAGDTAGRRALRGAAPGR
ncbi:hypothetical protein GCM10010121_059330 [Streptomyces brasiliensis]|uniref:Fumarylacetoacetase-like C-terminal domain-containing protein n=1 Tax=Streptomyces brasiliensis TaxID=1954 RepID=A0A917NYB3_9ACTN|nr:hypothetical protein GCM10010121_059330 [Streptomyces brasiliensis]